MIDPRAAWADFVRRPRTWTPFMPYQPKILVADDERSIRLMLETGLTLNGFRVTQRATGREASKAANSAKLTPC